MDRDALKHLEERKASLEKEINGLFEAVKTENRDFSAEDDQKYDALMEDVKKVNTRMKDILDYEADQKDLEESRSKFDKLRDMEPEKRDEYSKEEERVRKWLRGNMPDATEYAPRAIDFRANNLSETYRKAKEARTLSKLTAGAGGNLVRTDFLQRLYEIQIESSTIRQAGATVIQTDTGEAIQMPRVTAHGGAALVAEAGTIGASDPTFGQTTLDAYKYGVLMQVSNELVNDTQFDLLGYLERQAGRAVGNASGAHFISGDGSSKPNGLFTAATTGVTAASTTAITTDELVSLFFSVLSPYRENAVWIMRDASVGTIRKLKYSGSGEYVFGDLGAGADGAIGSILGRPVYVDPNVPAMGAAADAVWFGDVSAYYIRDVNGIRFERSDDFAFNQDLVSFRCLQRTDGDLLDTTAGKVLTMAAA